MLIIQGLCRIASNYIESLLVLGSTTNEKVLFIFTSDSWWYSLNLGLTDRLNLQVLYAMESECITHVIDTRRQQSVFHSILNLDITSRCILKYRKTFPCSSRVIDFFTIMALAMLDGPVCPSDQDKTYFDVWPLIWTILSIGQVLGRDLIERGRCEQGQ